MPYLRSTLRGSLALFGVALGLIGTAGVASADDAPAPAEDSAHVAVDPGDEATVETSAAPEDDAEIGDGLFMERPAPGRDPATELQPGPAPASGSAPAPAPAPAPAAPAATGGGVTAPVAPAAAATPATLIPARPTQVRGVQIERAATATSAPGPVALARTGVDNTDLTVLAVALLALGVALTRASRPRPSRI